MKPLAIIMLIAVIAGCEAPAPSPSPTQETSVELVLPEGFDAAEATIQAPNLLADVSTLASDDFEGRGPGSAGDTKTRTYLAGRLAEMGYEPLFEGDSYDQPVEIVGLTADAPESWTFTGSNGATASFAFADEYMIMAGVQEPAISVSDAEVVFVGYGIQEPSIKFDEYKNLGLQKGFKYVASGPFVRSSYNAIEGMQALETGR